MNFSKLAAFVALMAPAALAQSDVYQQCGGLSFTGPTTCVEGATCVDVSIYYSQCLPDTK